MTLRTADIAGVSDTFPTLLPVFFLIEFQRTDGGTKHVTGVGERQQHIIKNAETAVVVIAYEMLHHLIHLMLGIKRLQKIILTLLFMRVLAVNLLIISAHILFLNKCRVRQHQRTEITRSVSAIDIATKTLFIHIRNKPRMIDMRMGKHNTIERCGIKPQVAVIGIGLCTFTLVHTTVKKDRVTGIGSDQMFATCHLARRA